MVKDTIKMLNDYVTAWNTHDTDRIVEFFADNYVYEEMVYRTKKLSRQELIAKINNTFYWYSNEKKLVKGIFGTKSRACMTWVWSGVDDFKTYHSSGITLFQVAKEKISRESCYTNIGNVVNWTEDNLLIIEGILEEEHYSCPKQHAIVRKIGRILGKLECPGHK